MNNTIISIENITNPGLPVSVNDEYTVTFRNGLIETRTFREGDILPEITVYPITTNITNPGMELAPGDIYTTEYLNGSFETDQVPLSLDSIEAAINWRNDELAITDEIIKIEDHPLRQNYMFYRQALRDWPSSSDFSTTKPVLDTTPLSLMTTAAFLARFTDAEYIPIELASIDNPSASIEQRTQSAGIRRLLKEIDLATYINLRDPRITGALTMLASAGFLSVARKDEILNTNVRPHERYYGPI